VAAARKMDFVAPYSAIAEGRNAIIHIVFINLSNNFSFLFPIESSVTFTKTLPLFRKRHLTN